MFPVPRLFPFSSFWRRLLEKNAHSFSWYLLSRIRLSGSTFLGRDSVGNGILRLNKNSPLGESGDSISLPVDNVIFQWVLRRGQWEERESNFLADHVNQSNCKQVFFIDIGGQAGLVTRQFLLRVTRPITHAWIVEPFASHVSAIEKNCEQWIINDYLTIFPFALDEFESTRTLHIQKSNSGNASLIEKSVQSNSYEVHAKRVVEFEELISCDNSSIILKCDIQGMDSKVLSLFSKYFWGQVTCCVVEIWAIGAIESSNVEDLINRWKHFNLISWDSLQEQPCTLEEVKLFWLSKTGSTRNLYLSV
jgi:FkbM family methyltransferase